MTSRVKPTSSRWMVVNGLLAPLEPVVVEPVRNGTFWPTTILAFSLSMVVMLGVDNRLTSVLADLRSTQLIMGKIEYGKAGS